MKTKNLLVYFIIFISRACASYASSYFDTYDKMELFQPDHEKCKIIEKDLITLEKKYFQGKSFDEYFTEVSKNPAKYKFEALDYAGMMRWGSIFGHSGNLRKAEEMFSRRDKIKKLYYKENDKHFFSDYFEWGQIYRTHNYRKAHEYFDKALSIALNLAQKEWFGTMNPIFVMGFKVAYYNDEKKFENALKLVNEIEKFEIKYDGRISAETFWSKGDILIQMKKFKEAYSPIRQAYEEIKANDQLLKRKNIRILEDYLFLQDFSEEKNIKNKILDLIQKNENPQRFIRLPSGSYRVERKKK